MIGSGIFIVAAGMARELGSAGWIMAAWAVTGMMTIMAALSYGELSGMFPKAGGQYVYLKECYGPLVGFLYGWAFFTVIQTGTIAAVGVAFSKFSAYLFPFLSEDNKLLKWQTGLDGCGLPTFFSISAAQLVSILLIILLTYTNTKGVRQGKSIQNIFTFCKLVSLFGLIGLGFLLAPKGVATANWANAWKAMKFGLLDPCDAGKGFSKSLISGTALAGGLASAMVGSVFSSDAWNSVTFIAGEIKNPKRNIGLSLFLGTTLVTLIYMAANWMYLSVLPLDSLAYPVKDRVAVAVAETILGSWGTYAVAIMIMFSTFGCNNGLILSGARVFYSMAEDGMFFKQASKLNERNVPAWAMWAQCTVAAILCLSGKYGDLLDMVAFVVVVFYVLTIAGIFVLRIKRPDAERPYKAFGYPFVPALYIVMGLCFCGLLWQFKPEFTFNGFIIVGAGIPIYLLGIRQNIANKRKQIF